MAGSDAAGRLLAGGLSDLGAGLGQGLIGRRERRDERDQLTTEAETLRSLLPQEKALSIDDFLESPAKQRKKLTDTLKGALPDDDLASMSLGELKGTVQSLKAQLDFGGEMMQQQQEQQRQNAQLQLLGEVLPEGQYKSLAQGMASVGLGADAFGNLVGSVLDPMQDNRLAELDFGFRQEDADRKYVMDYLDSMRANERQLDAADLAREKFDADEEQRQFENTLAENEFRMKKRAAKQAQSGEKELTESQGKAVSTIVGSNTALRTLTDLIASGRDRPGVMARVGFGDRAYVQAFNQLINQMLRDESGGAITSDETRIKLESFRPKAADSPEVIRNKYVGLMGEYGARTMKVPEHLREGAAVPIIAEEQWEDLSPEDARNLNNRVFDALPIGAYIRMNYEGRPAITKKASEGVELIRRLDE